MLTRQSKLCKAEPPAQTSISRRWHRGRRSTRCLHASGAVCPEMDRQRLCMPGPTQTSTCCDERRRVGQKAFTSFEHVHAALTRQVAGDPAMASWSPLLRCFQSSLGTSAVLTPFVCGHLSLSVRRTGCDELRERTHSPAYEKWWQSHVGCEIPLSNLLPRGPCNASTRQLVWLAHAAAQRHLRPCSSVSTVKPLMLTGSGVLRVLELCRA